MTSVPTEKTSQAGSVELAGSAVAPPRQPDASVDGGSLLDRIVAARGPASDRVGNVMGRFLAAETDAERLQIWLGKADLGGIEAESLSRELGRGIARLDAMIARQVNAILHHPRFQQLEASWRGLWYLTGQAKQGIEASDEDGEKANLKIRILHLPKRELMADLQRALEFDQSQIFRKVYEAEFGTPGGEPFGVLLGDYAISNHPEDMELLDKMSEVAAAAFAPFIASADPGLLGLDDFSRLEQPGELAQEFSNVKYVKWRSLRDSENTRFVGLVLPRVLMRAPYVFDGSRVDGFRFREEVEAARPHNYLWGNAGYAFGSVLIRAFCSAGWFAEIRGFERGVVGGGLVTGLCSHSFGTDARAVATKFSTDVAINEVQEQELSGQGLIPLCPCKDTEYSVFFSNPSVHKPKKYDDLTATTNARISSMLQYVFCVSRFAHYLKVLERDKIGSLNESTELENHLNRWIQQYVAADEHASPETKARYPLRKAQVEVRPVPGSGGGYRLTIHLLPHSQLDQLSATIKLITSSRSAKGS